MNNPTKEITNQANYIDSREIIERVEYLEIIKREDDETNELAILKEVLAKLTDTSSKDPEDEITLIRDSYFMEYAYELAEDIGAIDANANWPNNHIDWDAATRDLQRDYSTIDFDGIEYWFRI